MASAIPNRVAPGGVSIAAELAFDDIHLHYANKHILRGITLSAAPGEVICLLGPSGSGKTSLLRVAAGLEAQTSGSVSMNGREIAGRSTFMPPEKRSIGLMFQDFALFPHMTVLENVRFGLAGIPGTDAKREAFAAVQRVGLEHHANAYPDVLSGGEQQRVALARALAPRPAVMLMDEPFSGLDTRLKDAIRQDTLAMLRERRATTILVTHDAEEAMRMGDRIALLQNGRICQIGTAEEIYHAPRNLFVAGFFGELNVFEGRLSNGYVQTPVGALAATNLETATDGDTVTVAVRTSGIEVQSGENGASGIQGRIIARRFVGDFELLELVVNGDEKPVRARIRADELSPHAKDVVIKVRNTDIMMFETGA